MSYTFLHLILWILNYGTAERVSLRNRAKLQAQQAYATGDYQLAASYYKQILNSSIFSEPAVALNLGHAYFKMGDLENARRYYVQVSKVSNAAIASEALLQLGWIAHRTGDIKSSLTYLRDALNSDSDNEQARYNFELLKKKYPTAPETPPAGPPQQAPPPPTVEQNFAEKQAELEDAEKKEILNKLRNVDLSKEQAQMILNGLRDREVQFIQQNRRKTGNNDNPKQRW